jgi:hypothetical protein
VSTGERERGGAAMKIGKEVGEGGSYERKDLINPIER